MATLRASARAPDGPYRKAAEVEPEPPQEPVPPTPRSAVSPSPVVPVVSDERLAHVIALMHARHPWLLVEGIILRSSFNSTPMASRTRFGIADTQQVFLGTGMTLGDVDRWVAGLWEHFGLATEPVMR